MYGTTANGGAAGFGTVYKLDTPGRETVVYDFTGGTSGAYPSGGVVFDTAGNLYGTANGGSANQGVVYKLDTGGQETVLYSFTGGAGGGEPSAGLVMDAEGNLYGATAIGGFGHGVVYKLDATGQETVLHNFGGASFGDDPLGVTRDAAGNLYGTTYAGGVANAGIAYNVNAAGRFTILHSFTGLGDGGYPNGGLVLDDLGNLYGTAQAGGAYGVGVVFRLDPAGEETVLYNFCSQPNCADGAVPTSGIVRDAAGNLYGTASDEYGYFFGPGVVYMLDGAGQETVLWTFNQTDGSIPNGVIRDEAGNLFGTTAYGGTKSSGVAFKITVP